MTQKKCTGSRINLQEIFTEGKDSFKELLRAASDEQFWGLFSAAHTISKS